MPTKISNTIKRQALEKMRNGMSVNDAAKLYAISDRTLKRWRQEQINGGTLRTRTTAKASPAPAVSQSSTTGTSPEPEEKISIPLDFQDSPAPVGDKKKSIVDQGLDSIKGMLGIKDTPSGEKKQAPPLIAKLDPKRQAFVDNVSPTISLGFIIVAGAMWQRIGPEYKTLTPDENTANRIVEPLVRIYARHASFLTEINPDWADAGASMFALAGYVYTSLALYQKIKEEKEAYEQQNATRPRYNPNWQYGDGYTATTENGVGNSVNGYADVPGASGNNVRGNSENGGTSQTINRASLTSKEQAQFAALSRLSQLDFESRARRSNYLH